MKILPACLFTLGITFVGAFALLQSGCDISSGNETIRNVSININGSYSNDAGIPERQSGATITRLSLSQAGDQLFAIDNEGTQWTGRIGNDNNGVASVTLRGLTTTGLEVIITGNISVSGTTATLTGFWVEPGLSSAVSATATVSAGPTATPTPTTTATPTATPVI